MNRDEKIVALILLAIAFGFAAVILLGATAVSNYRYHRTLQGVVRKSTAAQVVSQAGAIYPQTDAGVLHLTGVMSPDSPLVNNECAGYGPGATGCKCWKGNVLGATEVWINDQGGTTGLGNVTAGSNQSATSLVDVRVSGVSAPSETAADFKLFDKEGKTVLTITPKGEITPGPGITLDEAAKQFSAYLKEYMQAGCKEIK